MFLITDIYFKMDSSIVSQSFWKINIYEKKKLLDTELRKYIISKIQELDGMKFITNGNTDELNVSSLLRILSELIPQERHIDTISHFTHYIIKVAGTLQNFSIVWWIEDKPELIYKPLIEFDENELWINLKTHEKTDYVRVFNFVYDIFNNNFMMKNISKKLGIY